MMANVVSSEIFFTHVDPFIEYRKTVYESSDETIRSNLADIRLFKRFMTNKRYATISGESVMKYQMHLKYDRLNAGNSINRKLFSLKSYGHYLRTWMWREHRGFPFRDVLKIRTGYGNGPQASHAKSGEIVFRKYRPHDISRYQGLLRVCVMYRLAFGRERSTA